MIVLQGRSILENRLPQLLPMDREMDISMQRDILRDLEAHLVERRFAGRTWTVGDTPKIVDAACVPM